MTGQSYLSGGQRVYIWSDGTENLAPEPNPVQSRAGPAVTSVASAASAWAPTPAPSAPVAPTGPGITIPSPAGDVVEWVRGMFPRRDNAGAVVGADVGGSPAARARLDFGEPQISDIDQQYLTTLEGLLGNIGGGTPPQAPELPPAPTYTADPGLRSRADSARDREGRVRGIFDQQYMDMKADDPQNRNRWSRLGEWLSALAANGGLENAGVLMSQLMQEERDYGQRMNETRIDGLLRGEEFDMVADEADAGVLSGQHGAQERTSEAAYNRDLQGVDMRSRYAIAAYEAQQRQAGEAARLAGTVAEAQRNAAGRAEDRHRQAVGMFANIPQYAGQAAEYLVPEGIADPRARSALADGLTQQQATQGLQVYIQANLSDVRGLTRFLRQFDPSLTEEIVRRSDPMATFLRAINGPNAQQAFRANPQLATYAQYATAPE